MTLQELSVSTTDELWKSQYIDRTLPINRNRPLHKYLKIDGVVVYWKVSDAIVVSRATSEKQAEELISECTKEIAKLNYILKPCTP